MKFSLRNIQGKSLLKKINPKLRYLFISLISIGIFFSSSCALVQRIQEEKTTMEKFSRTYAWDYKAFHPRLNSALQEYAHKHKGNSFQIVRLGSDIVVIRGVFQRDGDQGRFFVDITLKPAGKKKTLLEMKISSSRSSLTLGSIEKASSDLFQIIEKGIGISF